MNQGDNSEAQTCEGLPPPTLATSEQTQTVSSSTENHQPSRRPRFGTSGNGRKFGGALAGRRKWPPRRVSFPSNDTHLVTGYLEPANPWEYAENVNREDLISTYRKSCIRHNTDPLESVLDQLENLEITQHRCDTLSLNGQKLEQNHCESLEEILKRLQFKNINLEGTSLDDESCVALFDMMEYYESAVHLNISSNQNIGLRGWQACSHMIKKTQCLEQLEAKNVTLNEQHMPILSRALRIASHLQVLKLENSGLSGRPTVILVAALKLNTGLKELYLADNDLGPVDAMQLGALLRTNNHLQLLDISNNNVQDSGVGHISDGLIEQRIDDKDGKGLGILVLWNNHITRNSSQHFSRAIARCKSLEMLNIGQNALTNETLHIIKESLQQNRTLLRLGMQSTHLTCEAAVALGDIISENHVIQRIDLRDNHLQIAGLVALAFALKKNKSVTQLDLDDQPRKKLDGTIEEYLALVNEIRSYCTHNEEPSSTDSSTEESESPQHRSRLSSVSSRKISLTCQTLPRSPPPIFPDGHGRTLLEPKRTSGGRLRSPAPSPIPSPVASPIPSPSRGRFVVSRVSETSLSSTNSSASSSPLTPPSRSSSPTCFFPPATGASRFRVTVVEKANSSKPIPKSVITSTNTNVTVGFQFKVDSGDQQANSDDSDDVFNPDPKTNKSNKIDTKNKPDVHVSSPGFNQSSEKMTHQTEITVKIQKTGETRCVVKDIIDNDCQENSQSNTSNVVSTTINETESEVCVLHQVDYKTKEKSTVNDDTLDDIEFDFCTSDSAASDIQDSTFESVSQSPSRDSKFYGTEEVAVQTELKRDNFSTDNGISPQTRSRKSSCIQKPPSSLEKLLGLFQHPGSLFSSSSSVEKLDLKNPLQSSVNTVMALGDKFHQYLRDGRSSRESSPQPPLQRSVSDAPQFTVKTDPVKSSSVPQLSSIQSLASLDVVASSTIEENNEKDVTENEGSSLTRSSATALSKNLENPERLQNEIISNKLQNNTNHDNNKTPLCKCEVEDLRRISSEQPLPENVQSKIINNTNTRSDDDDLELIKDAVEPNTTVLDSNEMIVNSVSSANNLLDNNKMTICVPKLKDIPEYSVLEISGIEVEPGGIEVKKNIKKIERICKCDSSTTTDSISLTSDRNPSSSPRNIICDNKQNIVNVVTTLGTSEILDNLIITPPFETSEENISPLFNNAVNRLDVHSFENYDSVQKNSKIEKEIQLDQYGNMNLLENRITDTIYNLDDNNGVVVLVTGNEQLSENSTIDRDNLEEETENANACQNLDNMITHPESTTTTIIDDQIHSSTPVLENIFKDEVTSNIENRDVKIRNSSLLYDSKLMENCNDIILEDKSLAMNHHNQFTTSQLTRTNGDSPRNEIVVVESAYAVTDIPALIKTNSRHQKDSIEESVFETVDRRAEFDRSDTDELIFNMTDISTDTILEDHVSSLDSTLNQSNESIETQQSNSSANRLAFNKIQSKTNTTHAVQSPTSLFIEKSKGIHRNSHDSGIEETNLSMSADSIPDNTAPRPLYQESTESCIDSEWSFAGIESDSNNELLKDKIVVGVSTEKDSINNNTEENNSGGEFINDTIRDIEAINDIESCQTSDDISTGNNIGRDTILRRSTTSSTTTETTTALTTMEIGQAIIVTSICSRNDNGETKTKSKTENEKAIEKLLVEVNSSEGRGDNEISGCQSSVVCSTSHQ